MATKKSKRSQAKKSVKPEKATTTEASEKKAEDTKVAAAEAKTKDAKEGRATKTEEPVEEVVEVVEIEEPTADEVKVGITDKLLALNPAALVAELLGTFMLTAGFLTLFKNTNYGALGIALIVAASTLIFAGVSGAHFNPAITAAQWITRKINGVKAIAYIVAQVLGAIIAFLILTGLNTANFDYKATVKNGVINAGVTEETIKDAGGIDKWAESYGGIDSIASQLGISKTAPKLSQYNTLTSKKEWAALLSELIGSFVLGLGSAYAFKNGRHNKLASAFGVGIAFILGLMIAGSTGILNPALSVVLGVYGSKVSTVLWAIAVYVIAPIISVTLAYLAYDAMTKNQLENEEAIAE